MATYYYTMIKVHWINGMTQDYVCTCNGTNHAYFNDFRHFRVKKPFSSGVFEELVNYTGSPVWSRINYIADIDVETFEAADPYIPPDPPTPGPQ